LGYCAKFFTAITNTIKEFDFGECEQSEPIKLSKWFLQLETVLVKAGFNNSGVMGLEKALGHLHIIYEQNKPKEETAAEQFKRLGGI